MTHGAVQTKPRETTLSAIETAYHLFACDLATEVMQAHTDAGMSHPAVLSDAVSLKRRWIEGKTDNASLDKARGNVEVMAWAASKWTEMAHPTPRDSAGEMVAWTVAECVKRGRGVDVAHETAYCAAYTLVLLHPKFSRKDLTDHRKWNEIRAAQDARLQAAIDAAAMLEHASNS